MFISVFEGISVLLSMLGCSGGTLIGMDMFISVFEGISVLMSMLDCTAGMLIGRSMLDCTAGMLIGRSMLDCTAGILIDLIDLTGPFEGSLVTGSRDASSSDAQSKL
jgi:hypothetical protein